MFVRQFGLIGYGYAEVAAICSYGVIHWQLLKYVRPSYGETMLWLGVSTPPLFAPLVHPGWIPLLWLPFLIVGLIPRSRKRLQGYTAQLFWRVAAPGSG